MKSIINLIMLLLSLFLLNACEGMSAVAKVALQQLPQKEVRISDLFPDDHMAQKWFIRLKRTWLHECP